MKIRIATKAWNGSRAAKSRADTEVGVAIPWVELDGLRTTDVIDAKVEASEGCSLVTLTFVAACEMVLLDADGEILDVSSTPPGAI